MQFITFLSLFAAAAITVSARPQAVETPVATPTPVSTPIPAGTPAPGAPLTMNINGGRPVPDGECCVRGTSNDNLEMDFCMKLNGEIGNCHVTTTAFCGPGTLVCV